MSPPQLQRMAEPKQTPVCGGCKIREWLATPGHEHDAQAWKKSEVELKVNTNDTYINKLSEHAARIPMAVYIVMADRAAKEGVVLPEMSHAK